MTEDSPPRMPPHPSTVAQPAAVAPVHVRTGELTYPPGTAPPRPPGSNRPTVRLNDVRPAGRRQTFAENLRPMPAPVVAVAVPEIDTGSDLGGFPAWGGGTVKIPLEFVTTPNRLSLTGWKILIYLVNRRGTAEMHKRTAVPIADVQGFLGGRITVAQVTSEFRSLESAKFDGTEVLWSTDVGGARLEYVPSRKFEFPDDKEGLRDRLYALVDLTHVRKFKTAPHLKFYMMMRYQSRVRNNVSLLTPYDARRMFSAPAAMPWGNVMQNRIEPAIAKVEEIAGIKIAIKVERATTPGRPVVGIRITAGAQSRFKDSKHEARYKTRMARRNVSAETEKFFRRDLDSALARLDAGDDTDTVKASVKKRILGEFYAECRANGKPARDGFHIVSPLLDLAYIEKAAAEEVAAGLAWHQKHAREEAEIAEVNRIFDDIENGIHHGAREEREKLIIEQRGGIQVKLFAADEIPTHDIVHLKRLEDNDETECGRKSDWSDYTFKEVAYHGKIVTCRRCRLMLDQRAK